MGNLANCLAKTKCYGRDMWVGIYVLDKSTQRNKTEALRKWTKLYNKRSQGSQSNGQNKKARSPQNQCPFSL